MKSLKSLIIIASFPLLVNAQQILPQNHMKEAVLKSLELSNVEYADADSIITYQFTTPTDSFVTQKQFNRYIENTQTAYYESWNWNNYTMQWMRYLAETVTLNDTEIITNYNWDEEQGEYVKVGKSENYVIPGFQRYTYFSYDEDLEDFIEASKTEYWFNIYDNDSVLIEYAQNYETNVLEYNRKMTTAYDTAQNKIQENKYNWEDGAWKQTAKMNYGYDTLGNQIQVDWYIKNIFDELINDRRDLFTYDSLNNMVNIRTLLLDGEQLANATNYSAIYDAQNRITMELNEDWDAIFSQWIKDTKTDYEYENIELKSTTGTGLSTKTSTFQWDPLFEWQPQSESVTITNESGLAVEYWGKIYDLNTETWNNHYLFTYSWDAETGLLLLLTNRSKNSDEEEWNITSKTYYYYDGVNVTRVTDNPIADILVYPNPVSKVLYISQKLPTELKIQVFNLRGQLIYNSTKKQTTIAINVAQLNPGQYILKGRQGEKIFSHKFLKTD